MIGPDYERPSAWTPVAYKELKGWKIAEPRAHLEKGAWWSIYHDPVLDSLERQVEVSNQNLAAAEAAYRQAAALVQEARAALFPTIDLLYQPTRTHAGRRASGSGRAVTRNVVTLETTGTWQIDVWGRIRRTIESDADLAQVSAADVANAKLAAQGQLAVAYFNLRAADSLIALLKRTVTAFKKTQTITENQYAVGTAARSDVLQAQTQVKTVEAQLIGVGVQRAQFEHAIAVLMGKPPAAVTIKAAELGKTVPAVPPGVPSELLERRPDIAAAERNVAAQNALIGVAATAYFPNVTINGFFGWIGPQAIPISVANEVWQIGATATETLFDGGLRRAQLAAAEATYYQAIASYRQSILTGFQQVEDNLASLRILAEQQRAQDEAVKLSKQSVDIALNEYRAGTVSFTTVVTAQATQLTNEQTALAIRQARFLASAQLVQALGGGWDAWELPTYEELRRRRSCVDVRGAIRGRIPESLPGCL